MTVTSAFMRSLLLLLLFTGIGHLYAQPIDSMIHSPDPLLINKQTTTKGIAETPGFRLTTRTLVVPVFLITYGFFSQANEELREFDVSIKNEVRKDADFHTSVDNYLQYVPGLAVYALNAAGIKGKNNFRDRTMIYLLSNVMMGITVQSIKKITRVQRPDGSGTNAFPSGHTATAFAGAQFLEQEYKNISPWYGIAGYAAATTTGILRMYNNKHWFRDVVAGAGFGILSTEVAYKLEPIIAKKLFHKKPIYHFDPAHF